MQMVGYKLVDSNNDVIQQWGGISGQTPGIPNLIVLPNGDQVHAPNLIETYGEYRLIEWYIDDPAPQVPNSISPRQVRLLLLQKNLLSDVETMIQSQDQATQIAWEYATEFVRTDPLLIQLAQNLNLTDIQLDEFFIEAKQL